MLWNSSINFAGEWERLNLQVMKVNKDAHLHQALYTRIKMINTKI